MSAKNILFCSIGVLASCTAQAAIQGWNIKAGVVASESFNDNLTLVNSGKIDDYITEINPYVNVSRKTRRLKMDASYQLQNLIYANEDQFNDTFHQLQGDVDANFVRDIFFVKGSARFSQQNISNTGITSLDNTSVTGNRTNVGTLSVNPYMKYRFGRNVEMLLSAERGIVRYGSSTLDDSDRNVYRLTLDSGRAFRRFKWGFDYLNQKIETDNQIDTTLEEYDLDMAYKITRLTTLVASAGYEDHDYVRAVTTDAPDDAKWNVGLIWEPSSRTSVEIRGGDRFYGNTALLNIKNRTRRTSTELTYMEDVTIQAATQFESDVFPDVSDPTAPEVDPELGTAPNQTDISLPGVSNEVFIRKRFSASFSLNSPKSLLTLSAFNERRDYQTTDDREKVWGLSGLFNWKFAQRTRAILSATGQILNVRGSNAREGVASLKAGVERQLRRKLSGSMYLIHNRKETSSGASNYRQYIATIGINWKF